MTQVSFLKDQPLFGVEVLFSAFSAFSAVEVLAADELSLLAELELLQLAPYVRQHDPEVHAADYKDNKISFFIFSS